MGKLSWPDANEYDDLVTLALLEPVVADRVDVFLHGLDDAVQAHRVWALDTNDEIRREGAARILKREQERRKPRVPVTQDGLVVGHMPREVGRRNRSEDGRVTHQREIFDYLTFEELREKRDEFARNARALQVDIHGIDRLLTLQELAPGTQTPAEACEKLGYTVEEFLASAA